MMPLFSFEGLNSMQIKAASATDGYIRIVAGAGTGKTRVLVHRYAYLVQNLGCHPSNILCVTFTNKAANEMRRRIEQLAPNHLYEFVCTIHSFCVKFLRKEIYRIGYPQNFTVADQEDARFLLQECLESTGLTRSDKIIGECLNEIAGYKFKNDYLANLILNRSLPNEFFLNQKLQYLYLYIKKQSDEYTLDYNDLILFTLYILRHYSEARSYWQNKIKFLLVDEAQDCSKTDWELIYILSNLHRNLFVVGDPDQCIYEWRGAKPELFLQFPSQQDIILTQNYRSTQAILNLANAIIRNNKKRIAKDLLTENEFGQPITFFYAVDHKQEATWIADKIHCLLQQGVEAREIAVLYRAAYISRFIEQALIEKQIKYVIWGGIRFFERKEVKDLLAYLHFLEYQDNTSLKRIINTPSRKFGKKSLEKLQNFADEYNISLYDALIALEDQNIIPTKNLTTFLDLIDQCLICKETMSLFNLTQYLLRHSGLEALYEGDTNEERLENIKELLSSIDYYEKQQGDPDTSYNNLAQYLQDISLYTNADYKKDSDFVKLMTIHQAKGLEFKYLFLCRLSDGVLPSYRSTFEEDKLEEERRLMYVAVTRTQQQLFFTDSMGWNEQYGTNVPSRFLFEIDPNLFKREGNINVYKSMSFV